jgi:hypothetical protein
MLPFGQRRCAISPLARPEMRREIPRVIGTSPPYALAAPRFPFPSLAALAGRAPLGGQREVALAALVTARLALGLVPPESLPQPVRAERAAAARTWLATLAPPAAMRVPLARLTHATAGDAAGAVATAMAAVRDAAEPFLDAAAHAELGRLVGALRVLP